MLYDGRWEIRGGRCEKLGGRRERIQPPVCPISYHLASWTDAICFWIEGTFREATQIVIILSKTIIDHETRVEDLKIKLNVI